LYKDQIFTIFAGNFLFIELSFIGNIEIAKKIEAKRCEKEQKNGVLVLQKQAKIKRIKLCFASFRF
jgi:hypothetical protein